MQRSFRQVSTLRLGLTPSAKARFEQAYASAENALYHAITEVNDLARSGGLSQERSEYYLHQINETINELIALSVASDAMVDANLEDALRQIERMEARLESLRSQFAREATEGPASEARKTFLWGAAAVALALTAGLAWIHFSKRT